MKRTIITTLLAIFMAIPLFAGNSPKRLFEDFEGMTAFEIIYLGEDAIRLAGIQTPSNDGMNLGGAVEKLNSIESMTTNGNNYSYSSEYIPTIAKDEAEDSNLNLLFRVKDTHLYGKRIQGSDNKLSEVLLYQRTGEKQSIIYVTGIIDGKKLMNFLNIK